MTEDRNQKSEKKKSEPDVHFRAAKATVTAAASLTQPPQMLLTVTGIGRLRNTVTVV